MYGLLLISLMSSVTPVVADGYFAPLLKDVESVDVSMVLRVMMLQSDLLQHLIYASFSFFGVIIVVFGYRSRPVYRRLAALILAYLLSQWLGFMMGVPGQGPEVDGIECDLDAILARRCEDGLTMYRCKT